MAQFTVRHLEDDIKARLKRRAQRHGANLEEEVRQILRNAVRDEPRIVGGLGSRIAARFRGVGLSGEIVEQRGQAAKPATFKP